MNPDFRITDDRLRQMNRSQKEAKRKKCFCQIKEMVYFWTPVKGVSHFKRLHAGFIRTACTRNHRTDEPGGERNLLQIRRPVSRNAASPIGGTEKALWRECKWRSTIPSVQHQMSCLHLSGGCQGRLCCLWQSFSEYLSWPFLGLGKLHEKPCVKKKKITCKK